MSRETLELLAELLSNVQLPVAHPEFEENARKLAAAKRELAAALAQDG